MSDRPHFDERATQEDYFELIRGCFVLGEAHRERKYIPGIRAAAELTNMYLDRIERLNKEQNND